jgi:hypothetical protein
MRLTSTLAGAAVCVSALVLPGALSSEAIGAPAAVVMSPAAALPAEPDLPKLVSEDPADHIPNVMGGQVNAIVVSNGIAYVGGQFTQVQQQGGSIRSITNLFAFNVSTGKLVPGFAATVSAGSVDEIVLAPDRASLWLSGTFAAVNGMPNTKNVARVRVDTGAVVTSFKSPQPNGKITDLNLVGSTLYVGGAFTKLGGQPTEFVAALNSWTGAKTSNWSLDFAGIAQAGTPGVPNTGHTDLRTMDVSPDGTHLVVGGNFTTINGKPRVELAMIDLPGGTLSAWRTDGFDVPCQPMAAAPRDLDFTPDGSAFALAASGGIAVSWVVNESLCDAVTLWPTGPATAGKKPIWVSYSGGDTLSQVLATSDVVYAGGHMKAMNNLYANSRIGPGGVARPGLAALDMRNGMPYSWNPTRGLDGYGVTAFTLTDDGLWMGHDTRKVHNEIRGHLALFPFAGGTPLESERAAALPGDVYLPGAIGQGYGQHVTARIRPGFRVSAGDGSGIWLSDGPFATGGGVVDVSSWPDVTGIGTAVPAYVNQAVFDTSRWNPGQYDIPAPAGHSMQLRLYFTDDCMGCTPGQRRFYVNVDGVTMVSNLDIIAETGGPRRALAKTYNFTADGNVDIDFAPNVTGHTPVISAIELIDNSVPATPVNNLQVPSVSMPGSAARPAVAGGGVEWGSVRGAFMVNGVLYTGWVDGTIKSRSFNGTAFGPAESFSLFGYTDWQTEIKTITGMFYDKVRGRLYYTRDGLPGLFYRYFEAQSRLIGGERFTANIPGANLGDTAGMFLAGTQLYIGSTSGKLTRYTWANGQASNPTVVGGPNIDGKRWSAQGMFLYAG